MTSKVVLGRLINFYASFKIYPKFEIGQRQKYYRGARKNFLKNRNQRIKDQKNVASKTKFKFDKCLIQIYERFKVLNKQTFSN